MTSITGTSGGGWRAAARTAEDRTATCRAIPVPHGPVHAAARQCAGGRDAVTSGVPPRVSGEPPLDRGAGLAVAAQTVAVRSTTNRLFSVSWIVTSIR